MNPFTFIKDYNHETLLEAKKLEKLEIHYAKSRTVRIFNIRCLANKVTPKTFEIKWKGNTFEQAIIKKAEHLLIRNRIKCTNIKINHLQNEIANTKTSQQQKLVEPTFTDLQNIILNKRKRKHSCSTRNPNQEAQGPHLQILHNNLQDGHQDN